ncbi:pyridoxal phosphate-dependent decarboxylase family protein [Sphingosinicella rhizophila]|uniref:Aminotransferase class I/II-fold pyridoxal phosphate-dependent enzyme n=1 Tax=Sphingosinicella rhizophila TaxID=3050082 RepID=A0ABU3Q9Z8_9SPHN|nr:aminotransferase class I/II-fold pyridoxal phosphate-dependent enzyme [Sphingosinicella sp. GR2756]MDT9600218.1 aminotransferase class I/II-fold pyridoxal phosphate-dependent enzyme [Sphingosinicella sp. GR2756]
MNSESAIEACAAEALARIFEEKRHMASAKILEILPEQDNARLRALARPGAARPVEEVVREAIDTIYNYRVRMDHPHFFGFIPSPASSVSWLGDLLTAGFNAHAGSWMQSSGPSAIEAGLIDWLAERVGMPSSAGGLFVSGGSMANLTGLIVARDQKLKPHERGRGIAYVSDQTHSSVAKGLGIIGFLPDQVRKVGSDGGFRIDMDKLAAAIREDRANGLIPFAVIASCGTTNTGSIDPLDAIADLARAEGIWMHVDGAYGASVSLSGSHRDLVCGLARADSLSWDAHKWLFQTYGCGMVLVRDNDHLVTSFSTRPEYLRDAVSLEEAPNFWDYGPELTRPARAMKLWLTLQVLGIDAIGAMIDHGIGLAETLEGALRARPDWQIVSPASLAITCFRYCPSALDDDQVDRLNDEIARAMIARNVAAPLTTRIDGRTVLRVCAISPEATAADMADIAGKLTLQAEASLRRMRGD